ncbi:hypothetical protein Q2366_25650, partial [Escherichia coli]|nr:hypothetical protein [Escherichia coli]
MATYGGQFTFTLSPLYRGAENYLFYAPPRPELAFPLADGGLSWGIETWLRLWQPTVFNTPNKG